MLQQQTVKGLLEDEACFTGVAEEEEEDFMIDERNDIYTAKGIGMPLQVPVTAAT